jgi:hypothetical protein
MRRLPLALVLVALTHAATAGAVDAKTDRQWRAYVSHEGHFAITFPGTPWERDQHSGGDGGTLAQRIAEVEDRNARVYYAVGVAEYPKELALAAPDKILDAERDRAIANVRGRLLSETKLLQEGATGAREIVIETATAGFVALLRVYLVGQRRYQVLIVLPAGQEPERQFFDSFRFEP